jgi:hypothetical protein
MQRWVSLRPCTLMLRTSIGVDDALVDLAAAEVEPFLGCCHLERALLGHRAHADPSVAEEGVGVCRRQVGCAQPRGRRLAGRRRRRWRQSFHLIEQEEQLLRMDVVPEAVRLCERSAQSVLRFGCGAR